MLPKIHKPQRPPAGRPIISGNDSPAERISQLVDHFPQPCVPTLTLKIAATSCKFYELVPQTPCRTMHYYAHLMGAHALYTNIPHQEGITVCAEALRNHNNTDPISVQSIITLLRLILTLNKELQWAHAWHLAMLTSLWDGLKTSLYTRSHSNLWYGAGILMTFS